MNTDNGCILVKKGIFKLRKHAFQTSNYKYTEEMSKCFDEY